MDRVSPITVPFRQGCSSGIVLALRALDVAHELRRLGGSPRRRHMDKVEMHQIGEVADAVGLSLRTIRYYEEVGLVTPSGRTAGGYRLYTGDDIERLRLVKTMKPLEFSLDDMRDVLHALDRVAVGSGAQRDAALDRLRLYAALAQERVGRLREELHAAEATATLLRKQSQRAVAGRGHRPRTTAAKA
jgi:DNA-binding transcriptional MerR regulator